MGIATKTVGNSQCQTLGGHLPIIHTTGKQKFLTSNFGDLIWIALTCDNQRFLNIFFTIVLNL